MLEKTTGRPRALSASAPKNMRGWSYDIPVSARTSCPGAGSLLRRSIPATDQPRSGQSRRPPVPAQPPCFPPNSFLRDNLHVPRVLAGAIVLLTTNVNQSEKTLNSCKIIPTAQPGLTPSSGLG